MKVQIISNKYFIKVRFKSLKVGNQPSETSFRWVRSCPLGSARGAAGQACGLVDSHLDPIGNRRCGSRCNEKGREVMNLKDLYLYILYMLLYAIDIY